MDTRPKNGVSVQVPILCSLDRLQPPVTSVFSAAEPMHDPSTLHIPSTQVPLVATRKVQESDSLCRYFGQAEPIDKSPGTTANVAFPKGNAFDGNILQYMSFLCLFDAMIKCKTDTKQDKLQFDIHYTKRQAQELVKSCQNMDMLQKGLA